MNIQNLFSKVFPNPKILYLNLLTYLLLIQVKQDTYRKKISSINPITFDGFLSQRDKLADHTILLKENWKNSVL